MSLIPYLLITENSSNLINLPETNFDNDDTNYINIKYYIKKNIKHSKIFKLVNLKNNKSKIFLCKKNIRENLNSNLFELIKSLNKNKHYNDINIKNMLNNFDSYSQKIIGKFIIKKILN